MPRRKLPPRLYFDGKRREWVVRYIGKFKRTGLGRDQEQKAQAILLRYANLWRDERTIYFITCMQENFPVKIGCAIDLTQRLSNLATALPWPPVMLASFNGDRTDEIKLHAQFREFRMRGDWFRRTDQIMEFAASIRKFESLEKLDVSRAISAGVISGTVPISVPMELSR